MSFLEFFSNLPLPFEVAPLFLLITLFIALGVYKFVKDWLPW